MKLSGDGGRPQVVGHACAVLKEIWEPHGSNFRVKAAALFLRDAERSVNTRKNSCAGAMLPVGNARLGNNFYEGNTRQEFTLNRVALSVSVRLSPLVRNQHICVRCESSTAKAPVAAIL